MIRRPCNRKSRHTIQSSVLKKTVTPKGYDCLKAWLWSVNNVMFLQLDIINTLPLFTSLDPRNKVAAILRNSNSQRYSSPAEYKVLLFIAQKSATVRVLHIHYHTKQANPNHPREKMNNWKERPSEPPAVSPHTHVSTEKCQSGKNNSDLRLVSRAPQNPQLWPGGPIISKLVMQGLRHSPSDSTLMSIEIQVKMV